MWATGNAALFADDALVLHALVLAAQALVILHGTENAGAKQAVTLGLEGTVVDRLRFLDLTERPRQDLFRRCNADPDLVKRERLTSRVENVHDLLVHVFTSILCRRVGRVRQRAGFLLLTPWLSQVARL